MNNMSWCQMCFFSQDSFLICHDLCSNMSNDTDSHDLEDVPKYGQEPNYDQRSRCEHVIAASIGQFTRGHRDVVQWEMDVV